jgi:hypothetical protein
MLAGAHASGDSSAVPSGGSDWGGGGNLGGADDWGGGGISVAAIPAAAATSAAGAIPAEAISRADGRTAELQLAGCWQLAVCSFCQLRTANLLRTAVLQFCLL